MINTSQEDTLVGKTDFEIWAATFGIKINRYHAESERFSEQPFRSAIEDANHTMKFCGVRYHHQNDIVEIKIVTVTIGARALLIHEK